MVLCNQNLNIVSNLLHLSIFKMLNSFFVVGVILFQDYSFLMNNIKRNFQNNHPAFIESCPKSEKCKCAQLQIGIPPRF